jgi:hypothetical protein
MKLLARMTSNALEWIDEATEDKARSAFFDFKEKLLFISGNRQFRQDAIRSINEIKDTRARNLLISIIESYPVAFRDDPLEDIEVGRWGENLHTLNGYATNLAVTFLLNDRIRSIRDSEDRESAYMRCLNPLVTVASQITLIDRYAAESMGGERGGFNRSWLIQRLMQSTNCDIRILTEKTEADLSKVERTLRKLLSSVPHYEGALTVDVFNRVKHNRRININFSLESVTLLLEKGIDGWSSPRITEDTELGGTTTYDDFYSRVSQIESTGKVRTIF